MPGAPRVSVPVLCVVFWCCGRDSDLLLYIVYSLYYYCLLLL